MEVRVPGVTVNYQNRQDKQNNLPSVTKKNLFIKYWNIVGAFLKLNSVTAYEKGPNDIKNADISCARLNNGEHRQQQCRDTV